MIALVFVNAALSCAVLISELPTALPRTPSKTLGASRPYAEGCDCAFVEAANALINIIPTNSATSPRRAIVIDQLLLFRCDDADVGAAHLRQFYVDPAPEASAVSQTAVRSRYRF